jgi:hypothetical protein
MMGAVRQSSMVALEQALDSCRGLFYFDQNPNKIAKIISP